MCISNDVIEDTKHFLLLYPSFDIERRDLIAGVLTLVRLFGLSNSSNETLTQLLIHGYKDLPDEINRNILELNLRFIYIQLVAFIEFVQILPFVKQPSSPFQVPFLLTFLFEHSSI